MFMFCTAEPAWPFIRLSMWETTTRRPVRGSACTHTTQRFDPRTSLLLPDPGSSRPRKTYRRLDGFLDLNWYERLPLLTRLIRGNFTSIERWDTANEKGTAG